MKCPNCNKDIEISSTAFRNAESYSLDSSVLAHSECCGIGFEVEAIISFNITPYFGSRIEDDWGIPIKKYELIARK